MAEINVLESKVFNQISAGEVIDNPASIVKELVENSIDAGATAIDIRIKEGGLKNITISDNGCGMDKNNLIKSILPHATSKLKEIIDIDTISTLGFRGEALASITSVSEVKIQSKDSESEEANYIVVKGGDIVETGKDVSLQGTTISVSNLFYNTPARYKFLKPAKSEENNITKLMIELILANPYTSFTYYIEEKIKFFTTGEGLEQALFSVFGSDIACNMLALNISEHGYKIQGYCAKPNSFAIKNNRNNQIFIINGRVINNMTISSVIQNAYQEELMRRTFPSVVLDIVIPFNEVDVNVHPAKREVRFANQRKINGLVYSAIRETLEKEYKKTQEKLYSSILGNNNDNDTILPPIKETIDSQPTTFINENKHSIMPNFDYLKKEEEVEEIVIPKLDTRIEFHDSIDIKENYVNSFTEEVVNKNNFHIVGQLFGTYVLIENNDKLMLLDQHACHERINYEKLLSEFNSTAGCSQQLIFPYRFDIDFDIISNLKNKIEEINKLGFDISIEKEQLVVSGIPSIMKESQINDFVEEFLSESKNINYITDITLLKDKIASIACKKSIKGGVVLTNSEIDYFLDNILSKNLPLQCPHGRPTIIEFSKTDIEKMFRRKL